MVNIKVITEAIQELKDQIREEAEKSKKSYHSVFTVCLNIAFKIAGDACAVNEHVGDAISATYNIKLCAKE